MQKVSLSRKLLIMIKNNSNFDVVVIGAGVAGIAAGYYLTQAGLRVALIDKLAPMSFTSAQSGENYRNWWPHPTMTSFTNDSITLMESLSVQTANCLSMKRGGYLLASRKKASQGLIDELHAGYGTAANSKIRIHTKATNSLYEPAPSNDWQSAPDGVDVIEDNNLIHKHFPYLANDIDHLIHIRRAGDVTFHPLGQFMLSKIKEGGGRFFQGSVENIEHGSNVGFKVSFDHNGQETQLASAKLVNAAGPFVSDIAELIGCSLPVKNIIQQKISFEDGQGVISRDMPFVVDLDDGVLPWDDEDKEILAEDPETRWLLEPINGGIHCRPDGGKHGSWVKLGWAFNAEVSTPCWQPELNPLFPDIVLRGASKLNPALSAYIGKLPRNSVHYGGYYTMTDENWPIIGPMAVEGAYVVGALSGFGTMAACGAGSLLTTWITGGDLPRYAKRLSMERYNDQALMQSLAKLSTGAL